MRVIYTKHIPFSGYVAITFFEWVIARKEFNPLDEKILNHESIHVAQNREMAYIFFYLWYAVEYLVRLIQYKGDMKKAYANISLEREAYDNDDDTSYISRRRHYAWRRFL